MAELSDEKIEQIRQHLFAVSELLSGVPVNGRPNGKARETLPLQHVMLGIRQHTGLFTSQQLRETLEKSGVELRQGEAALPHRLRALVKQGVLESPYTNHFRLVVAKKEG